MVYLLGSTKGKHEYLYFSADTICQTVLHVLVCGRSALFCSLSSTSSLYEQSENLVEKLGPYKFYRSFIMMFGIKWATTRQKITFLHFFFFLIFLERAVFPKLNTFYLTRLL